MYLLVLFTFRLGRTYFWRFEEAFCLKPALRAVFRRVFLARPLRKKIDSV